MKVGVKRAGAGHRMSEVSVDDTLITTMLGIMAREPSGKREDQV